MIKLSKGWYELLEDTIRSDSYQGLLRFLKTEYGSKQIYPDKEDIFKALNLTPIESVRVVIIGQDPYPREGEADGLSFSVKKGHKIPAGLRNIFKEIKREYKTEPLALTESEGELSCWAKQGVLLLNSILTVETGKPNSHKNLGWEIFTDEIIRIVSGRSGVVFMLWGSEARKKKELIDSEKNLILEANHPSQPSRFSVFAGNNHFIKANEWLKSKGLDEIVW